MSDDEQQNYDDYKEDLKNLVRSAAQDALHEPIDGGISLPSRITALESIMTERNRVAESNGRVLIAVVIAIIAQIGFGLVGFGEKSRMINELKEQFGAFVVAFTAHQAADMVFRDQVSIRLQTVRSELEKEIYQKEK